MNKNYVYSGAVLLIAALVIGALVLPMSPLAIGGPESPPLYEGISIKSKAPYARGQEVEFNVHGQLFHEAPYSAAEKMFDNGAKVELHIEELTGYYDGNAYKTQGTWQTVVEHKINPQQYGDVEVSFEHKAVWSWSGNEGNHGISVVEVYLIYPNGSQERVYRAGTGVDDHWVTDSTTIPHSKISSYKSVTIKVRHNGFNWNRISKIRNIRVADTDHYKELADTKLVSWEAKRVVNGQWENTYKKSFTVTWKIPNTIPLGKYKATSKWKIRGTDTVVSMSSASLEKTSKAVKKTAQTQTQVTPLIIATAVLALAGIGLIGVGYRREE